MITTQQPSTAYYLTNPKSPALPTINNHISLTCTGCWAPLTDKSMTCCTTDTPCCLFVLLSDGSIWHTDCLACTACGRRLANDGKCFVRNGRVYCPDDYLGNFGHLQGSASSIRRCASCKHRVKSSEWIVRSRSCIFHRACFICPICSYSFRPGDLYRLIYDRPACLSHLQTTPLTPPICPKQFVDFVKPMTSETHADYQDHPLSLEGESRCEGQLTNSTSITRCSTNHLTPSPPSRTVIDTSKNIEHSLTITSSSSTTSFASIDSPIRQRTSSSSDPTMTLDEDDLEQPINHSPTFNGLPTVTTSDDQTDQNQAHIDPCQLLTANLIRKSKKRRGGFNTNFDNLCFSGSPTSSSQFCINLSACRQKRMRTSFKQHQLRAMKAYFSINHNPDVKDLKTLTEKTGLSKRVLQVWFQNARAKYRRSLTGQDSDPVSSSTPSLNSLQLSTDNYTLEELKNSNDMTAMLTCSTSISPFNPSDDNHNHQIEPQHLPPPPCSRLLLDHHQQFQKNDPSSIWSSHLNDSTFKDMTLQPLPSNQIDPFSTRSPSQNRIEFKAESHPSTYTSSDLVKLFELGAQGHSGNFQPALTSNNDLLATVSGIHT